MLVLRPGTLIGSSGARPPSGPSCPCRPSCWPRAHPFRFGVPRTLVAFAHVSCVRRDDSALHARCVAAPSRPRSLRAYGAAGWSLAQAGPGPMTFAS